MKKFLTTLLVVLSLVFASTTQAAIETYTGEGTATSGDSETMAQVVERAKLYAKKNALEQSAIYIQYRTTAKVEFVDDELVSDEAGVLKVVGKPIIERNLLGGGDALQVHVTLTAEIDTDALQRELDKRNSKPVR